MARIPDHEIERLKQEISVQRLAEARGIELKKLGKELRGLCPFHADTAPSLVINPEKNLWHCLGACQQGGSVIDWVMKAEGVSFRHAVELLRADLPSLAADASSKHVKKATIPKLEAPFDFQATDAELMKQVIDYYHQTLKNSPEALKYLEKRRLQSAEMIETFKLGFCNRTLGFRLPGKNRQAGKEIRSRLQAIGILRKTGHEHFNGSLIIPVIDEQRQVTEVYGRKITPKLRKGTPDHLYLPGPHKGVWNMGAFQASEEVILCESLIDALSFWCAGYRNVTASYGAEGFRPDHLKALIRYRIKRVLIAYDRDKAGDKGALTAAMRIIASGIDCYRIQFPLKMDANDVSQHASSATEILGDMIRKAVLIDPKDVPSPPKIEHVKYEQDDDCKEVAAGVRNASSSSDRRLSEKPAFASSLSAKNDDPMPADVSDVPLSSASSSTDLSSFAAKVEAAIEDNVTEPSPRSRTSESTAIDPDPNESMPRVEASPLPPSPPPEVQAEVKGDKGDEVAIQFGDRRWRIRGLSKNLAYDQLKVNVLVGRSEDPSVMQSQMGSFHVDTYDLYNARQRQGYIKQAAEELKVEEGVIKKDLGQVLLKLEELQDQQIQQAVQPKQKQVELTDEEKAAAFKLLKDPKLLDRILEDFDRCGVVGEQTNKLVGYLAAVSRKLEEPLAIVIQSSSAAGKSSLMEAILSLIPPEEQVKYSAMTGQSLFYMGETDLKHKILAIVEEEGAERASYALKLLQSEGELTIASTGKDPASGRLVTHEYRVEGPVMIFLTTTAIEIDEELLNRCIVLSVDEEQEQTKAIHQLQRQHQTLRGLLDRRECDYIVKVHQNAQRLLRPLLVANPYAEKLTFLNNQTRTRRDHMKYLTLIRSIALLHQYQKPIKRVQHAGKSILYIEVTLDDIAMANRLTHQVLGRSLDELSPQSRRFLELLDQMVTEACQKRAIERQHYRFCRRDIIDTIGWSYKQVRSHLDRLVELEYVVVHQGGRGQQHLYELLYDGGGQDGQPFMMGLIDVAVLENIGTTTGLPTQKGEFAPTLPPHCPPIAPSLPMAESGKNGKSHRSLSATLPKSPKSTYQGPQKVGPSYVLHHHSDKVDPSEGKPN